MTWLFGHLKTATFLSGALTLIIVFSISGAWIWKSGWLAHIAPPLPTVELPVAASPLLAVAPELLGSLPHPIEMDQVTRATAMQETRTAMVMEHPPDEEDVAAKNRFRMDSFRESILR